MAAKRLIEIRGECLQIEGRFLRIARMPSEHYDSMADPETVLEAIRRNNPGVDVLTFLQGIPEQQPRFSYKRECDVLAVLPIECYDKWWSEISCKTRNLVRKAGKKGVEIRKVALDADFVEGIERIYAECPVRQGKRFLHYQKDAGSIHADLATFEGRSEFYGAYREGELIGFIKFVEGKGFASLMHIFSSLSSRDLSPTNALLDHAIRLCAERGIPYLHYGDWSRGGLGLFKRNHGFLPHSVPRYWVPFTAKGGLWLAAGFHRPVRERIPAGLKDKILGFRRSLNDLWYRDVKPVLGRWAER